MAWLSEGTFTLICLAVILVYLYLTWHHSYFKKRAIPYDAPSVLLGSLADSILMRKNLGQTFTDLYNSNPSSKVVGWFKFRTPALLIRDPAIIHNVLVKDFNSFRNNDAELDDKVDPILGRNIFVLNDEMWKKSRALITPAFTAGKIKAIYPQMSEVGKEFAKYLKAHPGEFLVQSTMSRYTSEVVAKCALGIEGNCFKEETPTIQNMGKLMFEPGVITGLKFLLFLVFPGIMKLFRIKMVPSVVIDFFDSVLRDVIVYRQDHNVQRNDLVQYLIEVKRKTIEVEKGNIESEIVTRTYTDDDVLSGCVMFFLEGYATSSVILTSVLYLLALNPEKQDLLRAEVEAALSKGDISFEELSELTFLNGVLLETNRLLPAAFHLQKRCTERYEMDIGKSEPLVVEKGTSVVLPLYAIHLDSQYYENPDEFKPERFANKEEINYKAKGVFLPFGDGPRMCIGVRIASTMIKVALINIISQFEIKKTAKTPAKIDPDPSNIFLTHKGGMYLELVPRQKN